MVVKFHKHTVFSLLICIFSILSVAQSLDLSVPNVIYRHVYTLEHLMWISAGSDGSGTFTRNTILVLYTSSCRDDVGNLDLIGGRYPVGRHLVVVYYNWEEFPARVWYKQILTDRIEHVYKPRDCPSVYFLPKGHTPVFDDDYVLSKKELGQLSDRIWNFVFTSVSLINECESAVEVKHIRRRTEETNILHLNKGERYDISAHLSDKLVILDPKDGSFLRGYIIGGENISITSISDDSEKENEMKECMTSHRAHEQEPEALFLLCASEIDKHWIFKQINTAGQTLYNLKHHFIIPLFTETGYEKMSIPASIYNKLLTFYRSNKDAADLEDKNVVHLLNNDYVPTKMVNLNKSLMRTVSDSLKGILESWCSCSLEFTFGYGIREYFRGSFLRKHVDRIDTHVISAILQVDKELGSAPDWPLEVIDLQGDRQNIFLQPGEMLLYESTKIIHGRPSPFQGRTYANVFVHFRPKLWNKKYKLDTSGDTLLFRYGDGKQEPVFPLETPITDHLVRDREKDEL